MAAHLLECRMTVTGRQITCLSDISALHETLVEVVHLCIEGDAIFSRYRLPSKSTHY